MKRVEISITPTEPSLLFEGNVITATAWSLTDKTVRLHAADGGVFAEGLLGVLGEIYLRPLDKVTVSAINNNCDRQSTTLPRFNCLD